MQRKLLGLTAAAALSLASATAWAQTVIEVQYPYAHLFDKTHQIIAKDFEKANPDIKIKFRGAYESYEDGSQKVLKEAITNRLPDVSFQGLNRVRILVERGIAQPLEPFIAKEANFEKDGYHKAMLDIGTYNGKVYGLPFAVSLPITYYNMDLVKKAGGDPENLPKTWDEVIVLAKKINALGDGSYGMFFGWNITGNWFWQALNFSRGGAMLNADESKVAFGGDTGKWSMKTFARFTNEAKMPNLGTKDAAQVFASGKVGMFFWSTSILARMNEWVGDKFVLKTGPYPDVKAGGGLPAGGNAAVLLTKDPKKQAAAWKYIKFATSGRGAAVVAQTTGYMPPNKKANEVYLKDFYAANPNNMAAVKELPLLRNWYAFPGKNGLKITDVIYNDMQAIVTGERANEPLKVLEEMVGDTQKLLPKQSS